MTYQMPGSPKDVKKSLTLSISGNTTKIVNSDFDTIFKNLDNLNTNDKVE